MVSDKSSDGAGQVIRLPRGSSVGHVAGPADARYTTGMLVTLAADSFNHYGPVGVLLLMGLFLGVAAVVLSHLLGPRRAGKIKAMTYESGMNPIGTARRRFNVRFYMVAMAFLVFDVEIVFLYPWATVFPSLGEDDPMSLLFLGRMLFFVATTILAFIYAWGKGIFRYD